MDPIEVPESLTDVSDADLESLKTQVKEAATELSDSARDDDEALDQIEQLATEFNRIKTEQQARADAVTASADREARADEALSAFEDEPEPQPEPEPTETQAATTEPQPEPEPTETATPEPEPEPEAGPETTATVEEEINVEQPAGVVTDAEEPTPTSAAAAAGTTKASTDRLRARRPESAEPRVEPAHTPLIGTSAAGHDYADREIEMSDLAKAISDRARTLGAVPSGVYERITMGQLRADYDGRYVGGDEFKNFEVFEAVRHEARALVASGGNCAPLAPSYDFFRLAQPLNPVEQALPVVEAERGGIRFITPPDFTDAADGVRVTTETEDADGYTNEDPAGSTDPKPCVAVECPAIEECRVDAVSQCVQFGNLNYRVFPEQVQAFLEDLGVIFTQTKEVFYLDAIDAASTAVTSAPSYGATRGIVQDLAAGAAGYRRRHHMPADAPLDLLLPSWVAEFVKVDMVNDHSMGLGFLNVDTMAVAAEMMSSFGLNVSFYYDSATGAGQAFSGAQGAGALNPFPSTVVSYLYAPGTFVRLDAGTLDVGLVRDSTLNSQNNLQLFSEQWIQVCQVGLESVRIEHTLCPDGTAPEPVTPLVCGS